MWQSLWCLAAFRGVDDPESTDAHRNMLATELFPRGDASPHKRLCPFTNKFPQIRRISRQCWFAATLEECANALLELYHKAEGKRTRVKVSYDAVGSMRSSVEKLYEMVDDKALKCVDWDDLM